MPRPLNSFNIKRHIKGVGLIEVLIAMVVAALGLLGIASALMLSLKNNQSAMEHSSAVNQAYAITEIMRGDRPNAIIGRYNLNSFTCNNVAGDNAIGASQNIWLEALRAEVNPTACGRVVCNSASCTISIRWSDSSAIDTDVDGNESSAQKTYTVVTRL